MNYYILTGASKGLGFEIARQLLDPKNVIYCISRSLNPELQRLAQKKSCPLVQLEIDLSYAEDCEGLIANLFSEINLTEIQRIALINNAADLEPVGPAQHTEPRQLTDHLHINLLAPMLLTAAFIQATEQLALPKTVLNLSSGASKHPYAGWSAYCTTKAGLEMYSKVVALEQANAENPTKIISFAPGIIDTGMQALIRSKNEKDFPAKEKFVKLHVQGALLPPDKVALTLIKLLFNPQIKQGEQLNFNHLSTLE